MIYCVICDKEVEIKEDGICLDCQKQILKAFGVTLEFLDEEPHVKVKPKEKKILYDFIVQLSSAIANIGYNFHAVKHHAHSKKEVEVVNIERTT